MQHIRVGSFFSGLGAFEKALERLGIPHEIAFYCEIDKYASQSFSLIHSVPESLNLWDITKVDEAKLPDFDLMTWGFPCQDISVAGKQAGVIEGETRSGLYYDGIRILRHKKPKYSIIENVKNLTSEAFRPVFYQILCDLEDAGYKSYWQVLNAKDYGVPQNRERVFIVSIRNDIEQDFDFPIGFDNGIRLKDLLEDEVDEKYYISQEKTEKLIQQVKELDRNKLLAVKGDLITRNFPKRQYGFDSSEMFALRTAIQHGVLMQVGMLDIKGNEQIRRVYSEEGLSPTLNCMEGGNRQPKVLVEEPTVVIDDTQGFDGTRYYNDEVPTLRSERSGLKVLVNTPEPELVGGIGEINFGKQYRQGNRIYSADKTAVALMSGPVGNTGGNSYLYLHNYRIRKLTPLEAFRLMDFDDADWQVLVDNGISDSQLYKMAGNSIVVRALEKIMENLFMDNAVSCTKQLALFG